MFYKEKEEYRQITIHSEVISANCITVMTYAKRKFMATQIQLCGELLANIEGLIVHRLALCVVIHTSEKQV